MRFKTVFALLLLSLIASPAFAKKKKKIHKHAKHVAKVAASTSPKLQTDVNFNDSVLHGRYQTPEEATARVENEKLLSDLLTVRTNFKDRLKRSSEQN